MSYSQAALNDADASKLFIIMFDQIKKKVKPSTMTRTLESKEQKLMIRRDAQDHYNTLQNLTGNIPNNQDLTCESDISDIDYSLQASFVKDKEVRIAFSYCFSYYLKIDPSLKNFIKYEVPNHEQG